MITASDEEENNNSNVSGGGRRNRFAMRTSRSPYEDRAAYLKAMSQQLTPDIWDMIVMRAVQDATLGNRQDRAKAREWFAKYILPYKMEIELHKETHGDYSFLSEIYYLFKKGARSDKDIVEALSISFGALSPEERATLRDALAGAESEEVRKVWDDAEDRQSNKSGNV